jgi:hypothetical protein
VQVGGGLVVLKLRKTQMLRGEGGRDIVGMVRCAYFGLVKRSRGRENINKVAAELHPRAQTWYSEQTKTNKKMLVRHF